MSNYKISRRMFLAGSGAVFTLPLLEVMFMKSALSAAASDPRRWITYYFPNGTYNRADKPIWATGDGVINGGNTSLALSPFSNMYGEMTSITNLISDLFWQEANVYMDDHQSGAASWMTFVPSIQSDTNSFDHLLGNYFNKPAIVLSGGPTSVDHDPDSYISYKNGKGDTSAVRSLGGPAASLAD